MSFPIQLTAYLTGTSICQLRNWKRTNILIPEINAERPMLYSFRDLVALRSLAVLRASNPLQRIRRAINELSAQDLTEHISEFRFATDGRSIKVWTDSGFMDLVENPGQWELKSLEDIYAPFNNFQGRLVPDFRKPRPHIEVKPQRLGGWPTIAHTRIPFDVIADLYEDDDMTPDEVREFYDIDDSGINDALDFNTAVQEISA